MRVAVLAVVAFVLALPAAAADGPGVRAKSTVTAIAALGPRPAGSTAERRAGAIVQRSLRGLGYRVIVQGVPLPRGGASRNIVGLTSKPFRVVVVAHLDGVRAGPAANDNGSGLGAMLEAARALRDEPGVLVAALGAEEWTETGAGTVHLGSQRLLAGISRAGRKRVRLALSLDMVGVGPSFYVLGIESRPNRSARLALAHARRLGLRPTYRVGGDSDHAELSRGGLAAAWLMWRWDNCWHEACDVASRVSAGKLGATVRVTIAAARMALEN